MMKAAVFFLFLTFVSMNLSAQQADRDYCQYVNPFIGTERMGHTFPGAAVPFGMVQLSPDTDTIGYWDTENNTYNRKVYEYCAGYQYEDNTIVGFSHTHFSGTGHSDLRLPHHAKYRRTKAYSRHRRKSRFRFPFTLLS